MPQGRTLEEPAGPTIAVALALTYKALMPANWEKNAADGRLTQTLMVSYLPSGKAAGSLSEYSSPGLGIKSAGGSETGHSFRSPKLLPFFFSHSRTATVGGRPLPGSSMEEASVIDLDDVSAGIDGKVAVAAGKPLAVHVPGEVAACVVLAADAGA